MARTGYGIFLDEVESRFSALGYSFKERVPVAKLRTDFRLRHALRQSYKILFNELRTRNIDRMGEVYQLEEEALIGGEEFAEAMMDYMRTLPAGTIFDLHPRRAVYRGPLPSNWDAWLAGETFVWEFDG